MRRVLGILAIAATIAACNVVPHKGSISAHKLSGQIVDFDTGKPIAGATVCAKYAKLDLQYYLRGVTETDANGRFVIPAAPESVYLLDRPDAPQTPFLNVVHPEYASTGRLMRDFTEDREVTIRVHRLSDKYLKSAYIDCTRTSGKAP
jgi:hypothetical protein